MNELLIIGRLTKDIEFNTTQSGKEWAKLTVAVSDGYKDRNGDWIDQTEFFDLLGFNEFALKAVKGKEYFKGDLVWAKATVKSKDKEREGVKYREHTFFFEKVRRIVKATTEKPAAQADPAAPKTVAEEWEEDSDLPF